MSYREVVRWLRRFVHSLRHRRQRESPLAPSDEVTPEQARINSWVSQGWREVWEPTLRNPDRRQRLWAWVGDDGLVHLAFGGERLPERTDLFCVNDRRVYRSAGHPDGPSSVPYYVVTAGRVYPSEGYRAGPSDAPHFEVRRLRAKGVSATIRVNPEFGKAAEKARPSSAEDMPIPGIGG